MTTENTTENAETIEEKIEDTLENGMEKMIDAQEKMAEAFDTVSKRTLKLGEEWATAVSGTQKDFVELYRNMAKEPKSYAKNAEAWMNSMTEMQKRSIDFAKVVYNEQTEAANEIKDIVSPYFASGNKMNETAKDWMGMWMKPFQSFSA